MDNAQKAIMIGVGLFIAIIIISAVLLITNMGSTMIKKSTTDIGTLTDDLANQIVKDYDGKIIPASEALSLVNKYNISNDISIYFTNDTIAAPTNIARVGAKALSITSGTIGNAGVVGTTAAFGTKTALTTFTDNTNTNYIAPGTFYKTSVVKTASSGIIGIALQKAV